MSYKHIVILTGAGISVESGIRPFRGPNGIWTRDLIDRVATPEGFNCDAEFAHEHYNASRRSILAAEPNEAHRALARLAAQYPGKVTIITQNVDDLHTRGQGNYTPKEGNALYYMHGELLKARKMRFNETTGRWDETGETVECRDDITPDSHHVTDGRLRSLRPDTVWFGEAVKHTPEVMDALQDCDMFVAIGTSGHVPPANDFPRYLKQNRQQHYPDKEPPETIEINPYPTGDTSFDRVIAQPATVAVPEFVDRLLREANKAPWAGRTERSTQAPHR